MGRLAALAKIGNKMISLVSGVLMLAMAAYGGYSLWQMNAVFRAASPVTAGSGGKTISFAELQKRNPDVRGWITVKGTSIDYPVAQGRDDLEYVNKNVLGDFELSGAIFLAAENDRDFKDAYNLTYGHHMARGKMYGDLPRFTGERFFARHKKGMLYTAGQCYRLRIFAVAETSAYDRSYYHVADKKRMASLPAFVQKMAEDALRFRLAGFKADRQIIALSTCQDAKTDGRIIVFAEMIPVKDNAKAQSALARKRVRVSD
jgi:sortase B